ncbi:hypothetical protein R3O64_09830 [Corynebacterium hesseae]|uniref:hypothetical protein n=1 Tax=Corynebacterium hesseae TaxID=2913502 RepID=UPI0030D1E9EF
MRYELPTPPEGYEWRYKKDWLDGWVWVELIRKVRWRTKVVARFSTYPFMSPSDFLEDAKFTVDRALEIDNQPGRIRNAIYKANNSQRKDNNG